MLLRKQQHFLKFELLGCSFKTASELINASAGINELLLTREERMALRADVETDVSAFSGTGYKGFSACANYLGLLVIRMDSFLHYTNST